MFYSINETTYKYKPEQPHDYTVTPRYGWLGKTTAKRTGPQVSTPHNSSSFKLAPVPLHLEGLELSTPDNWNLPNDLAARLPKKLVKAINRTRYLGSVILTSNIHMAAMHVERANADWNKPGDPFLAKYATTNRSVSPDEPVAQLISAKMAGVPHEQPEMFEWGIRLAMGSKWMLKRAPKRFRSASRWVEKLLDKLDLAPDVHHAVARWWVDKRVDAKVWLRETEKMAYSYYMLDLDCESDWGSEFADDDEAEHYYDKDYKQFAYKAWSWDVWVPETIEVWKCEKDGTVTRCKGGPHVVGHGSDRPDLSPMPTDGDPSRAMLTAGSSSAEDWVDPNEEWAREQETLQTQESREMDGGIPWDADPNEWLSRARGVQTAEDESTGEEREVKSAEFRGWGSDDAEAFTPMVLDDPQVEIPADEW